MQLIDGRFVFAASDLNNYLECRYLTHLDRLVAIGAKQAPTQDDPSTELIARKGIEHEQRYLAQLRELHAPGVTEFTGRPDRTLGGFEKAEAEMVAAMERGDALIYQGTFFDGQFLGHPDFLRRIEVPCARWLWSYEVVDTKLALHAKPYFLIQLCNYSEHLERIQGSMPEHGYIILGNGDEQRFRLNDYSAYYRHVKQRFLEQTLPGSNGREPYPEKIGHCKICKWSDQCAARRKDDDHLSLVASMRRDQIGKFNDYGIATVVDLAEAHDGQRPSGMNDDTFARLRRQATMQLRGRREGPVYDLIEHELWEGFGLMPDRARGDVFFDMEGDPLYEPGRGLEYLFGCWLPDDEPRFKPFWALSRSEEKQAFERFIDFITERRRQYPDLHVYHYADYEKSALRRLAQLHATREVEVDNLLRGEVLVDLYAVVRQALVISEDSYSIKRLEKFYGFSRATSVKKGDDSIVMFERWLAEPERRDILQDIERYNADDCRSTLILRDWLLERRREAIAKRGIDIPFHEYKLQCHPQVVEGCRDCAKRVKLEREAAQTSELQRSLLSGVLVPESDHEYQLMSDDHRARYLLANLIAYHRREEKPVWWAFFDRCENPDQLLEFDKDAIGGLRFCADVEVTKEKQSFLYTYTFPEQHHKLAVGDSVTNPATGKGSGLIFTLDDDTNRLVLKWTGSREQAEGIRALIPGGPVSTDEQKAALVRIAEAYIADMLPGATRDLLLACDPRLKGNGNATARLQPDNVTPQSVSSVAQSLNDSYLFIQGPPGSGKSTTGSQVICDLLAAGKRVGVLSTGHKAIHHLLHKVEECAEKRGLSFKGLYKYSKDNDDSEYRSKLAQPMIVAHHKNEAFEEGGHDLAAGTAWLFSRAAHAGRFDYLFIDESGQVSLADAVAVSAAGKNIVLLGDPSQLGQVSQGSHPIHAGSSILEHLLGERQTVPEHRGIFLNHSYRMRPEICDFVSQAMYSGRLKPGDKTDKQQVSSGTGLRYIAITHHGNSRESIEEAERIVAEIAILLQGTVTDENGHTRKMLESDIIVVTPYNSQRRLIARKLVDVGICVRVGTVDKFQGQEAFVVFYSMATSSAAGLPRNVEFLFEPNRFNVAVSRARALSVLVCSPRLLDVPCSRPEQMASINLLCAFVEHATEGDAIELQLGLAT